ncbi:DUF1853 family protein [Lutibacter sp.]|uniref:DUF1853 family protein n=1 Tax=Lutibacter sp. TaxID=1925666 RepID=UPI001A3469AE|nr:DUF1853 family protein [Lutibacter sp.]MBI9042157.1 DUF1853 family protein [Lutibacter sp.]
MLDLDSKNIQLQFEGFCKTPSLWKNATIFELQQFDLKITSTTTFEGELPKYLRLGKRVERFVAHQLKQDTTISILAETIQIQQEKITVGEIDFLLKENQTPIHLEVVYKFYLYDETIGETEIEHFIGPNKKDSLLQKLQKLQQKQLPLLYNTNTQNLLNKLSLEVTEIEQKVLFKAQLFLPYNGKTAKLKQVNSDCVKGFYISFNDLQLFSKCKFYIPSKINWLQEIQTQVNWLTFQQFNSKVKITIEQKTSPLCWIKQPNGEVQKFFIVWW